MLLPKKFYYGTEENQFFFLFLYQKGHLITIYALITILIVINNLSKILKLKETARLAESLYIQHQSSYRVSIYVE